MIVYSLASENVQYIGLEQLKSISDTGAAFELKNKKREIPSPILHFFSLAIKRKLPFSSNVNRCDPIPRKKNVNGSLYTRST